VDQTGLQNCCFAFSEQSPKFLEVEAKFILQSKIIMLSLCDFIPVNKNSLILRFYVHLNLAKDINWLLQSLTKLKRHRWVSRRAK